MPGLYASPTGKALVPKFYLGEVNEDCKVYLFVFTGMNQLNSKLRDALTKWGKETGKNLFVGFWASDDPKFDTAVGVFKLDRIPAIVVTANSELAFTGIVPLGMSVYTKIDDAKLLQDDNFVDLAMRTLERLYLLFLNGRFHEAIDQVNKARDERKFKEFISKLKEPWGSVDKFLSEHKISVGFASAYFIIEPSKTG
jgi:hypothetical protein